ncbi:2OG-Fe dioxygenase family protein [Streptomyces sp. NPDC087851]|uniref:2OG-Fe dioxygenase family protein n=1 Tax=Streptomyces sp. NPDC087851 TaxID=3365810 RepID=UPI00382AE07F
MTPSPDRFHRVIDLPLPEPGTLADYATLPLDPYAGGRQRRRRFSQFRMEAEAGTEGGWALELLPHRPFVQSARVNGFAGGVRRHFEPIRVDLAPLITAGADALQLDRDESWQLNVHQNRLLAFPGETNVAVPEGPHRDGHDFSMIAVLGRQNVSGGVSQLLPTGGGEPFFEITLEPGQALVFDDSAMWHHATDIACTGGSGGFRDLCVVAFNRWAHREYGEEYELRTLADS